MKTTFDLDCELLREAKKAAIDRGLTLRALVEAGLRQQLDRRSKPRTKMKLTRVAGPVPWPDSVDVSSRRSLWDWIESEERKPDRN